MNTCQTEKHTGRTTEVSVKDKKERMNEWRQK